MIVYRLELGPLPHIHIHTFISRSASSRSAGFCGGLHWSEPCLRRPPPDREGAAFTRSSGVYGSLLLTPEASYCCRQATACGRAPAAGRAAARGGAYAVELLLPVDSSVSYAPLAGHHFSFIWPKSSSREIGRASCRERV